MHKISDKSAIYAKKFIYIYRYIISDVMWCSFMLSFEEDGKTEREEDC